MHGVCARILAHKNRCSRRKQVKPEETARCLCMCVCMFIGMYIATSLSVNLICAKWNLEVCGCAHKYLYKLRVCMHVYVCVYISLHDLCIHVNVYMFKYVLCEIKLLAGVCLCGKAVGGSVLCGCACKYLYVITWMYYVYM